MNVLVKSLAFAVATLGFVGAANASCDPGEQELKFSLVTAIQGHPKGEAAQAFADQINTKLQGRYCVVVYGNSELFDDDTVYEALLNGDVHFAAPSVTKVSAYTNKMRLFDLPFLFDGPLHGLEFLGTEHGQSMLDDFADDGFYAFGFWTNGMRQMSASVPIRGTQDAAGLTFRVSNNSPITAGQYASMGVETKRLSFSKVYDALKSGEVQGQENSWSNIESKRFYEVQAAVTETNHNYLVYLAMASQGFLDSLDAETRDTIINTMKLVSHERNRFAFELNQIARQNILDDGGAIIKLTPDELNAFRELFAPLYTEFGAEIGIDLVNAAIQVNAEADPYN